MLFFPFCSSEFLTYNISFSQRTSNNMFCRVDLLVMNSLIFCLGKSLWFFFFFTFEEYFHWLGEWLFFPQHLKYFTTLSSCLYSFWWGTVCNSYCIFFVCKAIFLLVDLFQDFMRKCLWFLQYTISLYAVFFVCIFFWLGVCWAFWICGLVSIITFGTFKLLLLQVFLLFLSLFHQLLAFPLSVRYTFCSCPTILKYSI